MVVILICSLKTTHEPKKRKDTERQLGVLAGWQKHGTWYFATSNYIVSRWFSDCKTKICLQKGKKTRSPLCHVIFIYPI